MSDQVDKKRPRRDFLNQAGATLALGVAGSVGAVTLTAVPDWQPMAHSASPPFQTGGWRFFTAAEAAVMDAIVDRLIPADSLSIGGREAGCTAFIDRQLGDTEYGGYERLYMQGPFYGGTPEQGDQSALVPRQRYRLGLAQLQQYCHKQHKTAFEQLDTARQDTVLKALESGNAAFTGVSAQAFFAIVLTNTMEGFFADPIYGGNRDMVSWKMLGFPGARYDYRDYVSQHNRKLTFIPLSIAGSPEWKERG